MACYNPIWAYKTVDLNTGEQLIKIAPREFIISNNFDKKKILKLPCGKCIGCKLDYGKMWATRCMLEAKDHEENYFITLTYDDEYIPVSKWGKFTLDKEDLKNFWKRLRRYLEYRGQGKIRYFACGEYGERTERPHYHAIVFGLKLEDKTPLFIKGDTEIYESEALQKIWGKGYVTIGKVTYESIAYTAGYVTKKVLKPSATWGKEPEFTTRSTHPGIAKNYFVNNKEKIYDTDEVIIETKYEMKDLKPPRYFDKMYDLEDPQKLYELKQLRKFRGEVLKEKSLKNSGLLTEEAYNEYQEQRTKEKLKKKSRAAI